MKQIFPQFEKKMVAAGLVEPGAPLLGFLDADLTWNRKGAATPLLEEIFAGIGINSLVCSLPREPYRSIIDFLAGRSGGIIKPKDCETRTFLHDLPVSPSSDPSAVIEILKRRKSVIVPGTGIITWGNVSLEQAFVTFSSVCFACFVKFFSDYLISARTGTLDREQRELFKRIVPLLDPPEEGAPLMGGPLDTGEKTLSAMDEAGKRVVAARLVDSFFGNISAVHGGTLYISQTGSSLDNLPGNVDPCSLSGASCAALTASSELSAHMAVVEKTGCKTILHGHPRFSVILSMDCEIKGCTATETCHIKCPYDRSVCGVPVVPGEVGTGPHGLCNTVPAAMADAPGVIVYGHGLFTIGNEDFNTPFKRLLTIENRCREEYFQRVKGTSDG